MIETVQQLKRNSRTIRQSRLGIYDEMGKFAAAVAVLVVSLAGAAPVVQYIGAGVIAVWCLITIPRWRRVTKYRIEDHCAGKNTKDEA